MEHPITPPPELIREWTKNGLVASALATQAAHWGADQELEACAEWIYQHFQCGLQWGKDLRAARRPKPPSLKQQALEILADSPSGMTINFSMDPEDISIIRRALESLPDPQD